MYTSRTLIVIVIALIISYAAPAQKGLHIGFSAGPDFTINKMDKNPTPPLIKFANRTSGAESFYLEYGFNNHLSIRTSVRNASFGYKTSFNIPDVQTVDHLYMVAGTESIRFNYLHYEIGLKNRMLLIPQRLYINQMLGIGILPTGNLYGSQDGVAIGNVNIQSGYLYSRKEIVHNNTNNFMLNASIGLEYLFWKNKYITLDVNLNKGFKEIDYLEANTLVYGQKYYNKISCSGTYASVQIGLKVPLSFKKKSDTIAIGNKNRANEIDDTIPKEDKIYYAYKKGSKLVGINFRVMDLQGTLFPFNVALDPKWMYFFRDKFAVGASVYFKDKYFVEKKFKELLIGPLLRYYFLNSKTNLFAEVGFNSGIYRYDNQDLAIVIPAGIGFCRPLGKDISLETAVKYMYFHNPSPGNHSIADNNILIDFGFNYHF